MVDPRIPIRFWQSPFPVAVLLLLALAVTAASLASPQNKKPETGKKDQDDVIQLRSDLIVVTVTATDEAGKYAHGLKAKDFTITEDNVAQQVYSFTADEAPFAATILFDMSGSMGHKFSLVRAAAANFVERIRDDDQVAVYGFNNKVKLFQEFSNTRDISEYVWDAEAKDMTSMYDCMNEAIEALAKREEKRRAILLISDGCDTSSRKATFDSVTKKALAAGINIYSVDLIDNTDLNGNSSLAAELRRGRGDMQNFAKETGAKYIHSPQGDKLEEAFHNIIEELRNQYTLTYYSTNDKRDGKWRKLNITTSNPKLSVRSRRGYFAPKG